MHERKDNILGFPLDKGMVQGRITRLANGYIGMTAGGGSFIIHDKADLEEVLITAAKGVARLIVNDLDTTENAQKTASFTFMTGDMSSNMPTGMDPEATRMFIQVMSQMNLGKPLRNEYTESNGQPIEVTRTNKLYNLNQDREDGSITGESLGKIIDAVESGAEVVIEHNNNNQQQKKKFHN